MQVKPKKPEGADLYNTEGVVKIEDRTAQIIETRNKKLEDKKQQLQNEKLKKAELAGQSEDQIIAERDRKSKEAAKRVKERGGNFEERYQRQLVERNWKLMQAQQKKHEEE